ncbi:MAG: integrase [Gaiellaceae bacterium]
MENPHLQSSGNECTAPCQQTAEVPVGAAAGTLAQREALTNTFAARYARAGKPEKTQILDKVCATTGWHRSHARKALLAATRHKHGKPLCDHAKYDAEVVAALAFCWTILDMPAGKRLAPVLPELVPVLRRHNELDIDDETAELLMGMSAATIDRRLAPQRQRQRPLPVKRIRPGSLLRDQLPVRTWAEWDHTRPGFVEIAVISHDGGSATGDHVRTVSATDIATGWTENRTIRATRPIACALDSIARVFPFPILGLDSGNQGAELDKSLLRWCEERRVAFTHSRPGCGGNHHVGQKNWSMLHVIAGGHRYDNAAELSLLNEIWVALSELTNYFYPQQHLVSVTAHNGRRRKEYETTTPYRRTQRHSRVSAEDKAILVDTYARINPAELHRQIKATTDRLHLMATAMARTNPLPVKVARANPGRGWRRVVGSAV